MQQKSELTEGWISAKFEEITLNFDGKRIPLKSSDRKKRQGQYPYYGASGIIDYINDYIFEGELLLISEDGANLVARSTPIAFIANGQFWVNNHAHIVQTHCNIPLEYLSFFFNSVDLLPFITGSAQPKLTQGNLKKIEVPLPPLPEQHRIVSAIEALFARLDATNEKLDKVPEILKKFRQSVLAAACEGRLTDDWRRENPEVKNAEILMDKMREEKEQLIKGRKEKKKSLLTLPKDDFLFNLPEMWTWTSLEDCTLKITDGEHFRPKTTDMGVFFLSAKDVKENGVNFEDPLYVSESDAKEFRKRCDPERGDILIVSRGAGVGRSCIVNTDEIFCLLGSVILVKPSSQINGKCLHYTLNSSKILNQLIDLSGSTAQQAIYLRDIKKAFVPLPPLLEQQEIARRVDALFAFANSIEVKVAAARERTEKLRQSILAKAFSGELVETEAEIARREGRGYESAEVLLERIKEERGKKR